MKCKYAPRCNVVETKIKGEDGKEVVTYGILYQRKDAVCGKVISRKIEDISTDRELVGDMAFLFSKCCLSIDCLEQAVVSLIS